VKHVEQARDTLKTKYSVTHSAAASPAALAAAVGRG
jgi:hypothetical protein